MWSKKKTGLEFKKYFYRLSPKAVVEISVRYKDLLAFLELLQEGEAYGQIFIWELYS